MAAWSSRQLQNKGLWANHEWNKEGILFLILSHAVLLYEALMWCSVFCRAVFRSPSIRALSVCHYVQHPWIRTLCISPYMNSKRVRVCVSVCLSVCAFPYHAYIGQQVGIKRTVIRAQPQLRVIIRRDRKLEIPWERQGGERGRHFKGIERDR